MNGSSDGRAGVALLLVVLVGSLIWVAGLQVPTARADVTTSRFLDPSISAPEYITTGPDGALWFTNDGNNSIGRITTTGVVTNYTASTISDPRGIVAGPDGALWFANFGNNSIGRITTAGAITNYSNSTIDRPVGMTAGPDGALWFTNIQNGTIGRITTSGVVTNYDAIHSQPDGITVGPDGALWYTNDGNESIGRITVGGIANEFPLTGIHSGFPEGIAAGPDGNLWFATATGNAIGRMTQSGRDTYYTASTIVSPHHIVSGPDGTLWFTNEGNSSIGRITTSGTATNYADPTMSGPYGITVGPDDALWFTNRSGNSIGRMTVPPPPSVPGAPAIGTATPGHDYGSVAFSPPASVGGDPILSYTATCVSSNGGTTSSATAAASPIRVASLTDLKTYTCSVRATNVNGTGPPSAASNQFVPPAVVPGSPGSPASVPSGTRAAKVIWRQPSAGGAPITAYVVAPYLGSSALPVRTFTSSATSQLVTNLQPGKTYRFAVAARNAAGTGPYSRLTAGVTVGAPGQPKAEAIVSGRSLYLEFVAPSGNGAAILKYTASCTSSNGGVARSKTGSKSPIVFSTLTHGKTYTCTVKATNSRGTGPASAATKPKTA